MAAGLHRTLELLSASINLAADDLLVEVAKTGPKELAEPALEALLARRHRDPLYQLVANFQSLPTNLQDRLLRYDGGLSHQIRQAYLSDEPEVYDNASLLIRRIPAYDQLSLILGSLEQESLRKQAAITLIEHLTNRLADELEAEPHLRSCADIDSVRRQFLATMEVSFRRFPRHRADVVPKAFLVLSDEHSTLVRETLADPDHPCHSSMVDALRAECDPRVVRWVFHLLAASHPPAAVLQVLAKRSDPWFVGEVLARVELLADPAVQAALHQVKEFAWLQSKWTGLQDLTPQAQVAAVIFATNCGMPLADKLAFVARMLNEGTPEARRTAACALMQFPGADATRLLVECLDDSDAEVQLAAVQQIRLRGLPNGLTILMPKLDHPDPRVRDAARRSLSDYTFERFLRSFEQMDERSRATLAGLISKIDPDTDQKIRAELQAEHRNHRIRALRIIQILGRADDFWLDLVSMLHDRDHVVRRSILDVLLYVTDPTLVAVLVDNRRDAAGNVSVALDEALLLLARNGVSPDVRAAAGEAMQSLSTV